MKRTVCVLVSVFVVAGLGAGCESEIDNKPAAKVEEAVKPAETAKKAVEEAPAKEAPAKEAPGDAAMNGAEGSYTLDLAASKFTAVGAKVTGDHSMTFTKMAATATVKDGQVTAGTVTIQMESVEADVAKLTGHLKSGDFFDVANHPTATFEITEVKKGTQANASHDVVGNLSIRGTTKSVSFPANVKIDGDAASIVAKFTINRKDFKIVYAGKADDLIKDDVLIKMNLAFKKG
jgi:polyisoprenoid-binding protein YceI